MDFADALEVFGDALALTISDENPAEERVRDRGNRSVGAPA
jgi:hypothetical protein